MYFPVMLTLLPQGHEGKFLLFHLKEQARMEHQGLCMKTQSKPEFKTICLNFRCFLFFCSEENEEKDEGDTYITKLQESNILYENRCVLH